MARELERIERTAIHEAGHTAVALVIGVEVERVHILPQAGGVTGATLVVARVEELGADGLAMLVAGAMAESLVRAGLGAPERPRTIPWMWRHRAGQVGQDLQTRSSAHRTDGERIQEMRAHEEPGATVHRPPSKAEIVEAHFRAGGILRHHWRGVYGIAAQLLEHGELSGEEAAAVFNRKCAGKLKVGGGSGASVPVSGGRIPSPSRPPAGGFRILEEPGPPRRRPQGYSRDDWWSGVVRGGMVRS